MTPQDPQETEEAFLASEFAEFISFLVTREAWMADAACAGERTEMFFPVRGQSQRKAKAICARCPVAGDCHDYANRSHTEWGIWGGKIRRRGKANRSLPLHDDLHS